MPKSEILYRANQEIIGKHIHSKQWVMYTGVLTIYDRKTYPIMLKVYNEIYDTYIADYMEDKKVFKGDSVCSVFGKVAKWYQKHGINFQS